MRAAERSAAVLAALGALGYRLAVGAEDGARIVRLELGPGEWAAAWAIPATIPEPVQDPDAFVARAHNRTLLERARAGWPGPRYD